MAYRPVVCPECEKSNSKSKLCLRGTYITRKELESYYNVDGTISHRILCDDNIIHAHNLTNEYGNWHCTCGHKGTYKKYDKCKVDNCEFSIGPRIEFVLEHPIDIIL